MKILYDYGAFSRQFYGGVSRYFVELARELAHRNSVQSRIIAPYYINRHLSELGPDLVRGRQLRRLPRAAGKLLNIYNRASFKVQANRYRPDVLHETYFLRNGCDLSRNPARVVTVYDMIHEKFPKYFSAIDRTAINKRAAVARADHVICISEATRRDLSDIGGVDADKISVVKLGFAASAITPQFVPRILERPYLLFVGVRSGYKNFENLLEAYAGSTTLHKNFKLACFGAESFTGAERNRIERLGLSGKDVLWMGGGDEVLINLYRYASAFVFPSLYEGFGMPPLEAMAQGCPVVCSNRGSIPEVVGDGGEYFDPQDISSITKAIENVVGSSLRMETLCTAGKERIKIFTWESCARGTEAVYSRLI